MTGIINGTVKFTEEDYKEVEEVAKVIRRIRSTLTTTQQMLLGGCNEDGELYHDIVWDAEDEDKHYDLWDRCDTHIAHEVW